MSGIFLLLGSNLGDRNLQLARACHLLEMGGLRVLRKSSMYETAPWGVEAQRSFLNQVVEVSFAGSPMELLHLGRQVEAACGRERVVKWGPRTLDVDILYFGGTVVNEEALKVPHPGIPERRFTLVPMVELAPDFIHPVLGLSQRELLLQCPDAGEVKVWGGE
jgi:2-amino-4-hydroxy-6-hydroxymethyldihydropteridine diphosphokinase